MRERREQNSYCTLKRERGREGENGGDLACYMVEKLKTVWLLCKTRLSKLAPVSASRKD